MAQDITNKYEISSDSYELFDNITRLLEHGTLKDSKALYKTENTLSERLGNILLKYYETGISGEDLVFLLNVAEVYNAKIEEKFNDKDVQRKMIFGYTLNENNKTIETSNSLFRKIREYEVTKIKKLLTGAGIDFSKEEETIEKVAKENTEKVISSKIDGTSQTLESKILGADLISINNELASIVAYYFNILKENEKIFIKVGATDPRGQQAKNSASSVEETLADNGFPLAFFDVSRVEVDVSKITSNIRDKYFIPKDATVNDETTYYSKHICIGYKEFNEGYRNILDSLYSEIALYMLSDSTFSLNSETAINSSIENSFRNVADPYKLLLMGNYSSDSFRYLHTSPYTARRAEESSLIAFYYGDMYSELSAGYGVYSYQREEISKFVDIFESTRQYYYKVLLNKAFINDPQYQLYEKLFISAVAINRMIDSSLVINKDVEEYNQTDIHNMLETLGMQNLDSSITKETFINNEQYLKSLVRNAPSLKQKKGSRGAIKEILNLFGNGDASSDLTKVVLVDNELKSDGDSNTITKTPEDDRLNFVEIPYDEDNSFLGLKNNPKTSYEKFLENSDKYWSASTVKPSAITATDVAYIVTKYVALKMNEDVYTNYAMSRYYLSFVKYWITRNREVDGKSNFDIDITTDSDTFKLSDIVNAICLVFSKYSDAIARTDSEEDNNSIFYGINADNVKNKLDEFEANFVKDSDGNYLLKREVVASWLTFSGKTDETSKEDKITSAQKELSAYLTPIFKLDKDIITDKTEKAEELEDLTNLNDILKFPKMYLDGDFGIISLDLNLNDNFEEFISGIFTKFFTTSDDILASEELIETKLANKISEKADGVLSVVLSETSSDKSMSSLKINEAYDITKLKFISDYLPSIQEALIFLINIYNGELENTVGKVSFSLSTSLINQEKFLSSVLKYYLSYTTELLGTTIIKTYNTVGENLSLFDNISIHINDNQTDMVFYDERLTFEDMTKEADENE